LSKMTLPCWTCQRAGADDVRHWLASNSDPNPAMSPSGLPFGCCRLKSNTLPPTVQISGLRHVST
jgi:hypothetical protein